jgi:hypothetical protein
VYLPQPGSRWAVEDLLAWRLRSCRLSLQKACWSKQNSKGDANGMAIHGHDSLFAVME